MTLWAIRHKATGQLMPLMQRNRGYSHWNPATGTVPQYALAIPRLLGSNDSARRCIQQWVALPNGRQSSYQSYDGEYDDIIDSKPDGRLATDLEIVRVTLRLPNGAVVCQPSETNEESESVTLRADAQ